MKKLGFFAESVANSYGQLFFSDNKVFAVILMAITFLEPFTGTCGLLSAIIAILFSWMIGSDQSQIKSGSISFNSLLTGLAMGACFKLSAVLFLYLICASLLTLFISNWLTGLGNTYKIPALSIPFVLSTWLVLMAASDYVPVEFSEKGSYSIYELWKINDPQKTNFFLESNSWQIPKYISLYLRSLGAVIFQTNVFAGIFVAAGLLLWSRIAFFLSLIGFLTGCLYAQFVQGNLTTLENTGVGFNYILAAIAVGGYFTIASWRSLLLTLLAVLLTGLCISAFTRFVYIWQLPVYSLPFSMVSALVVYTLQSRFFAQHIFLVQYQQFSPEKNLYGFLNRNERFHADTWFHIQLPFFGEWYISQGHDGDVTHRGDYRYAWDFVVVNELQKTYRVPGKEPQDFYCYDLPVLAPASGYVVSITDNIEDNEIGGINIEENWGNTIIIKHAEYFYSKISHIKKGSFHVKTGDYVRRGDKIASCGNSGRSPEPHIHFQLQDTAYEGAKTIKYPICYYVSKQTDKYVFHSFDYPEKNQSVFRIFPTPLLAQAFYFYPGKKMSFAVNYGNGKKRVEDWEVFLDSNNYTYIYCHSTGATAWFGNTETLHYFTNFKGSRNSLLWYFYTGTYKVLLSYFQDMEVHDVLPPSGFFSGPLRWVQDLLSPFFIFQKTQYVSLSKESDDAAQPSKITIASKATAINGLFSRRETSYQLVVTEKGTEQFIIQKKNICIKAELVSSF